MPFWSRNTRKPDSSPSPAITRLTSVASSSTPPDPDSNANVFFDLGKKVDDVVFNLQKEDPTRYAELTKHQAAVELVFDISGSMEELIRKGFVQHLGERFVALATRFDDDGDVPVRAFDHRVFDWGTVTVDNCRAELTRRTRRLTDMGLTDYALAIRETLVQGGFIYNTYLPHFELDRRGHKTLKLMNPPAIRRYSQPSYVGVITDGEPRAHNETPDQSAQNAREWMVVASYCPVFFEFMAIGRRREDFKLLIEFDEELKDRPIDNANFFVVEDPMNFPDEQLYRNLLAEYADYPAKARAIGLL